MRTPGDRLWIGIPGPTLDPALAEHLDRVRPGGVLLFRRNIVDIAQVLRLIDDLRDRLGPELHVLVDQEGGAVVRFERECTVFPGNLALGAVAASDRDRGLALARAQGRVSGRELRALGVTGNLAPVCDLTVRPDNPGVGPRSFGGDPALVGDLATEVVRGHLESGCIPVLKHFPGLGAADLDSHHALPTVPGGDVAAHLEPFSRAIRGGAPVVMTAHLVHRGLDPDHPATVSPRVVHEVLRGRLGFGGVVMSDDLEMGAVSERSIEERVETAVAAGHDVLCICHSTELQLRARLHLDALGAGEDPAVSARLAALGEIVGREPGASNDDGPDVARAIAEAALTVLRRGAAPTVIPDGERWLLVMPTDRALTPAEDPLRAEDLGPMAEALADRVTALGVSTDPTSEQIAEAARRSAECDGIAILTVGLATSPTMRDLVRSALEWNPRTLVVPLGDPGDLAALRGRDFTALTAYGYRAPHREALVRHLRGEIGAPGRWPVPASVRRACGLE